MIPDTPHGTHSKAEKYIFDKFRAMTFSDKANLFTAYHSLNLPQHARKRFGEIDFLLTGPSGIFVIEIKGGRVACRDGVWQFTDRFAKVHEKVESPFRQAESALHGLMEKAGAALPARIIEQFTIGYGVITPDQQWDINGAEWDTHTLADARQCNNLKNWLLRLFSYWQDRDRHRRKPDLEALTALNRFLRPDFETIVPLHVPVAEVKKQVTRMTEEQMIMVDVVRANQRVLCSGGAGTGKTFMAMELSRRWTAAGMNVILACGSPWLRHYLAGRFTVPNLTIALVSGVDTARKRTGVNYFDALIVDEGQDIFDRQSLELLDAVLKNGLAAGRWCFFHDINNQSSLGDKYQNKAFEDINHLKTAEIPLRINCRNTLNILKKVRSSIGADMGITGAGAGPAIREFCGNRQNCRQTLEKEISELIDLGGLEPGDITILSPVEADKSIISELPAAIRKKILVLDEYAVRSMPLQQPGFATIKNFKGLENEAVIVIDLPPPDKKRKNRTTHYVAMSRPRAVLSLIYQDCE